MRALIMTAFLAAPVHAQTPQCMGLPDALTGLAQKYAEAPRVSGLTSTGARSGRLLSKSQCVHLWS